MAYYKVAYSIRYIRISTSPHIISSARLLKSVGTCPPPVSCGSPVRRGRALLDAARLRPAALAALPRHNKLPAALHKHYTALEVNKMVGWRKNIWYNKITFKMSNSLKVQPFLPYCVNCMAFYNSIGIKIMSYSLELFRTSGASDDISDLLL